MLLEVFNMAYEFLSSTVITFRFGVYDVNISMLNIMLGGALFVILFKFIFKILK